MLTYLNNSFYRVLLYFKQFPPPLGPWDRVYIEVLLIALRTLSDKVGCIRCSIQGCPPRPGLSTKPQTWGLRCWWYNMILDKIGWYNSANGQPILANIARRPCLISAALYCFNVFISVAQFKGSNPLFPTRIDALPSAKIEFLLRKPNLIAFLTYKLPPFSIPNLLIFTSLSNSG